LKRAATLAIVFVLLLPVIASAQTRKRASRKPRATTASTEKTAEVVRGGATRVADQIKKLTHFVYLLGGVAKGIESADASIRRNEASPAIIDQIKKNKETIKTSLQAISQDLDKLEIDFRATPELNRYYTELLGVAAGAANAENQAAAGQIDQAGRTLLGVVNRLTDVLLAMR
jgi:hypothetical protein